MNYLKAILFGIVVFLIVLFIVNLLIGVMKELRCVTNHRPQFNVNIKRLMEPQ